MPIKNQEDVFAEGEADQYFLRNKEKLLSPDRVSRDIALFALKSTKIPFSRTLEVGCANGWRLDYIAKNFKAHSVSGIDPSAAAIADGQKRYQNITLDVGAASHLAHKDASLDLIIMHFVFHWIPRESLLKAVSEIDRCLVNGGHLLITDFLPDFPCKRVYHHLPGQNVFTYKQNYAALFEGTGYYSSVYEKKFNHDKPWWENPEGPVVADHSNRAAIFILKKELGNYRES